MKCLLLLDQSLWSHMPFRACICIELILISTFVAEYVFHALKNEH